jgi:Leucine-rich repeat (LRR) protein
MKSNIIIALMLLFVVSACGPRKKRLSPLPPQSEDSENKKSVNKETENVSKPDNKETDLDSKVTEDELPILPMERSRHTVAENDLLQFTLASPPQSQETWTFECHPEFPCPQGLMLSPQGEVSWQPHFEQAGIYHFKVLLRGSGKQSTVTEVEVTVTNKNRAPHFNDQPLITFVTGHAFKVTLQAQDPDPANSVTFGISCGDSGCPVGLEIHTVTGELKWSASEDQAGTYLVTAFAEDSEGMRTEKELTIHVLTPAQKFKSFCESENLTLEQKKTVDALKALSEQNQCSAAAKVLEKLPMLSLVGKELTDLSPLEGFTNARYLDLASNRLTNLKDLSKMPWLTDLTLKNNQLTTLTGIESLAELKNLSIEENPLEETTLLGGLLKLQTLYVGSTKIRDLRFLQGLTELRVFKARKNALVNLEGIAKTRLEELDLSGNKIIDAFVLQGVTSLHTLNLSHNDIEVIPTLDNHFFLRTLDLSHNNIAQITPLLAKRSGSAGLALYKLKSLNLSDNRITDFSPLRVFASTLNRLKATGNPIPTHTECPLLFPTDCEF